MGRPLIMGHRGDSNTAPENTLLAIERAIEVGIDFLETDISMTKDDELVLFHDGEPEDLHRVTGQTGRIRDWTLDELRELDLGYYFTQDEGKTYPYRDEGHRIITVREVFDQFPDLKINLDMKTTELQTPETLTGYTFPLTACSPSGAGGRWFKSNRPDQFHSPETRAAPSRRAGAAWPAPDGALLPVGGDLYRELLEGAAAAESPVELREGQDGGGPDEDLPTARGGWDLLLENEGEVLLLDFPGQGAGLNRGWRSEELPGSGHVVVLVSDQVEVADGLEGLAALGPADDDGIPAGQIEPAGIVGLLAVVTAAENKDGKQQWKQ